MKHPSQWTVNYSGGFSEAFIVILCLWMLMKCEILAKAYNFLLTRLQIFIAWVSKPSLLFKSTRNSFLSLLCLMTSFIILIKKRSFILETRWHLSFDTLRIFLRTAQKQFFLAPLVFSEWRQHFQNTHTECYHLSNS